MMMLGPIEPRFFIDHGMVHDRLTGKHITTDEDTVFCDGKVAACALLNELHSVGEFRKKILTAIVSSDERGQGQPFADAMEAAKRELI